jgi:hypothetical protein
MASRKFIDQLASRLAKPENLNRAEAIIQEDFTAAVKSGDRAEITECVHLQEMLDKAKEEAGK